MRAGDRREAPTGEVTFLFTDIEGSTWLVQHLGDAWDGTLHEHDRLLRASWDQHDGYEVSTEGDAFFVAFESAADAVRAAVDAQGRLAEHPWPEGAPLRVRIGMHTGEARVYDGNYVGLAVHEAARVKSAAHGGQILISDRTKDLAGDVAAYTDLGLHRLKDLAQPVRIHQVVAPQLTSEFLPPKTLSVMPNNFPIQSSTFVGREDDISRLCEMLADARLVTLTGAGGIGKTRLSLQVGAETIEGFRDGAWLVDLAPVSDPTVVGAAVAGALGVSEQPGRDVSHTVIDDLRPKQLLIVLDNCEHLIDACASIVHGVVTSCPDVRVLATSREALNVAGEQTYRLRSLGMPDPDTGSHIESIAQCESVRLFTQRVRAAQPEFELTLENAPAIAQVCRRLDGLPLAIELAAARSRSMSAVEIAERLDDRFRLLTGGTRMSLPRQRTLEATVAWSYDLLSPEERLLFDRLSVFAGGCSLDAAEQICSDEQLNSPDVLDHLTNLVERSLVVADTGKTGRTRYRLLETLRQFGRDRLLERGELALLRDRHLAWAADLATTLPGQMGALIPVEVADDEDNLRAAIEWAIESGDHAAGLRIVADVWILSGHLSERERWYDALLSASDDVPSAVAARAFAGAGGIAFTMGAWTLASDRYRAATAAAREAGDTQIESMALVYDGACHFGRDDGESAFRLVQEGMDVATAAQDDEMIRRALMFLAWAETSRDLDRAFMYASRVDDLSRREGTPFDKGHSHEVMGVIQALRGNLADSAAALAEAIPVFSDLITGCTAHVLESAAVWSLLSDRRELGAELLGSADRVRTETGDRPRPWERDIHRLWLPRIKNELDADVFAQAYARGQARTGEDARNFAVEQLLQ